MCAVVPRGVFASAFAELRALEPQATVPFPALSRYDEDHSEGEERWLTLGAGENGVLLVLSHTFQELSEQEARVRLISARETTAQERRQYEGG